VWVRNIRDGSQWLPGEVCGKTGPVSYEVKVARQIWKRHADQLVSQTGTQLSLPKRSAPTEVYISDLLLVKSSSDPALAVPVNKKLSPLERKLFHLVLP